MLTKIVLLTVALITCVSSLPQEPAARITGGSYVNIQQYPYIVSVQRNGGHICAGAIYAKDLILTAAHCLFGVPANTLQVRAGSSFLSRDGVVANVHNYSLHPSYEPTTLHFDIALIRLADAIDSNPNAKALALVSHPVPNEATGFILGWGTAYYGTGFYSDQLQMVSITKLSKEQCSAQPYNYSPVQITESMLCGVGNGRGACQGDDGGPFVVDNQLIGIFSWGFGCGGFYYPGVYTDILAVVDWIQETAKIL